MLDIDIPLSNSIIQVHLNPEFPKHSRKRHIDLRVSQVHTHALPGALFRS